MAIPLLANQDLTPVLLDIRNKGYLLSTRMVLIILLNFNGFVIKLAQSIEELRQYSLCSSLSAPNGPRSS